MPDQSIQHPAIPVIDLFAGPGGLSEGFSSFTRADGSRPFKIALSVEMDEFAHRTLELRAFSRQFDDSDRPDDYYGYLANPTPEARAALFAAHPAQARLARQEAWQHQLSLETSTLVAERVEQALDGASDWLLIGGPPCQAYSLAGRSRRAQDDTFDEDERHTLYRHYLRIIEQFRPPVFVMENVKGILSAKLDGSSTIGRVLADLRAAGPGYEVRSFVRRTQGEDELTPSDYVIRAEEFGIPQARHRVILLGIRSDLGAATDVLKTEERLTVRDVISDLPRLRSHLSRRKDGPRDSTEAWLNCIRRAAASIDDLPDALKSRLRDAAQVAENRFGSEDQCDAADDTSGQPARADWYLRDPRIPKKLNHSPRSHMASDLARYLFCAAFADTEDRSPKLADFPEGLLPAHKNVQQGISASHFADRFRVQMWNRPSTTITSHISKDGHYYIHPDASQCRSLSVREAARLQTFPDDYFFEGNQTQQYHQVGNAVPPLLARKLAAVVSEAMQSHRTSGAAQKRLAQAVKKWDMSGARELGLPRPLEPKETEGRSGDRSYVGRGTHDDWVVVQSGKLLATFEAAEQARTFWRNHAPRSSGRAPEA